MKKFSTLFAILIVVSLIPISVASARSMKGDVQKPMTSTQITEMEERRDAMRREMHDIVLESIRLLKEVATDESTKGKATQLEKRLQKHIDEMEKMSHEHGRRMKGR